MVFLSVLAIGYKNCLNNSFLQQQMEKSHKTRNQQVSIITYAALRKYSSVDTTPNTSSSETSSLMAEVGARDVLGPDSIIPLHIFLAESTQPEMVRENMQFNIILCQGIKMPPIVQRPGRCRYSAAQLGEQPVKWV